MPAEVILRLRWFRFNPKKRMSHSAALPFSDTWTFTAISCGKKDHVSTGQSVGPGEWNSASSSSSLRYLVRLLLHSPLLFYVPLPVDDGVSVLPPQPDVLYDTVVNLTGCARRHCRCHAAPRASGCKCYTAVWCGAVRCGPSVLLTAAPPHVSDVTSPCSVWACWHHVLIISLLMRRCGRVVCGQPHQRTMLTYAKRTHRGNPSQGTRCRTRWPLRSRAPQSRAPTCF